MEFNFSQPMTSYEFVAIIISIVALLLPFVAKICYYFFKYEKKDISPNIHKHHEFSFLVLL